MSMRPVPYLQTIKLIFTETEYVDLLNMGAVPDLAHFYRTPFYIVGILIWELGVAERCEMLWFIVDIF